VFGPRCVFDFGPLGALTGCTCVVFGPGCVTAFGPAGAFTASRCGVLGAGCEVDFGPEGDLLGVVWLVNLPPTFAAATEC
jgi:hypothetical protein